MHGTSHVQSNDVCSEAVAWCKDNTPHKAVACTAAAFNERTRRPQVKGA